MIDVGIVMQVVGCIATSCYTIFDNAKLSKENKRATLQLGGTLREVEASLRRANGSSIARDISHILDGVSKDVSQIGDCVEVVRRETGALGGLKKIVNAQTISRQLDSALQHTFICRGRLDQIHLSIVGMQRMEHFLARVDKLVAKFDEVSQHSPADREVHEAVHTFGAMAKDLLPAQKAPGAAAMSADTLVSIDDAEMRNLKSIADVPAAMRTLVLSMARPGMSSTALGAIIKEMVEMWDVWHIKDDDLQYDMRKARGNKQAKIKLGSGGFGEVYAGTLVLRHGSDRTDERVAVAIKEVRSTAAGENLVAEVIREALLQFTLRHHCIVQCHGVSLPVEAGCSRDILDSVTATGGDFDEDEDAMIVTERMTCNLEQALNRTDGTTLGFETKLKVMTDVASALRFLHSHKVVHRDVKPQNVLVKLNDEQKLVGNAKLSDFGCSRRANMEYVTKSVTTVGTKAVGTVLFMPPEALMHVENCKTTVGWDVWSFGVLLCFTFAAGGFPNHNAFDAPNMARDGSLRKTMTHWARSIASEHVRNAALQCFSEDPACRSSALLEFSATPFNYLDNVGVETPNPVNSCENSTVEERERMAEMMFGTEKTGSCVTEGYDTIRERDRMAELLNGSAAPKLKRVGEEISAHEMAVTGIAISADGSCMVSGSKDKTALVTDVLTGNVIGKSLSGHTQWVRAVGISGDGRRVVTASNDKTCRVWSVSTSTQVGETLVGHKYTVRAVAMSADGSTVVSGSWDNTVRVWSVSTCQQVGAALTGHGGLIRGVAISANGTRVVSGSLDKSVRMWDVETSQQIHKFSGHTAFVRSVGTSQDANMVVSGSDDGTVRVWDARQEGQVGTSYIGDGARVRAVAMTPDGCRIVSGADDQMVRVWDVNCGLHNCLRLEGHTGPVRAVAISATGGVVVSGSDDCTLRRWWLEGHSA